MLALLNPRLWIAAAIVAFLSFTHFSSYRAGKANVRNEWNASIAQANADARKLEQQRQRRADEASSLASKRAASLAADARRARASADGLRGAVESSRRVAAQSLDSANKRADALGELFLESVSAYRDLAETCDRHVNDKRLLIEAWPK